MSKRKMVEARYLKGDELHEKKMQQLWKAFIEQPDVMSRKFSLTDLHNIRSLWTAGLVTIKIPRRDATDIMNYYGA